MNTAIAKLKDGREVEVGYFYEGKLYPLRQIDPGYCVEGGTLSWTMKGEYIEMDEWPQDIVNIDDVLHDLDIPNTSYVVKTLANTKWSELPESKLRAMYDLLTGE